ncbi:cytochrome c oxidase subunit 7A2, mitochondrial [Anabrus simplex]|uniref:cytochrome c oxidase subunit 7A2, mitochondrial n=1 Tax=Anabrus simplex TaxID=316456 RepID=UPI0034DDC103
MCARRRGLFSVEDLFSLQQTTYCAAKMYYQFNNFTGRLIGNHATQPYYPISPIPLNKNDPPKIVFETPSIKMARETVPSRSMSSRKTIPGTNQPYGEVPAKLREKMERFQRNDGVLVHLKGGPVDKILYGATLGLTVVAIGMCLHLVYDLSFPKKE